MKTARISIAGRVQAKDLCLVAQYLKELGYVPESKSDLVYQAFLVLAEWAKQTKPEILDQLDAGESKAFLAEMGLTWPGDRASSDWKQALKEEVLSSLSPEQLAELNAHAQALKEAGDGMSTVPDLEDELSDLDQQLRNVQD